MTFMKNRLLIILSIALISLSGCNKKPVESESESESETETITETETEDSTIYDERNYEYVNKIEEPSSTIHSMEDLKKLTDYHAFYKDVDSFDVNLDFDYMYKTKQRTMESEINYLYWYGELVNGVMGISGTKKSSSTWTITYEYYDNAYINSRETVHPLDDLLYTEPTSNRSADYNDFATEDETKPNADVATSQQLWYAAEHGYRMNALPDTPAEKYYNLSKDLLRNIIKNDMTDYEKVTTIYDYIEHHSSYCYQALEAPDSDDPANFPDRVCAQYKAFFIEGFFDNNTIVCDGFSKIYTLLGRMEGLNIVRGSGTSDTRWTTKEVAGHAYCFVELDGKYYLSCPTWGQQRITQNEFVLEKNYFLSPKSYMDSYQCQAWNEFTYATSINNVDYFKNLKKTINGNELCGYINGQDPSPYFDLLKVNSKSFMNLYFANSGQRDVFINALPSGIRFVSITSQEYVFINI